MNTDQDRQKPFWVSAETIMQLTGWDKYAMNRMRNANPDFYKLTKKGGYLYDASRVPPIFIKEKGYENKI
jgi:predicted chitinase